ncbi:MAG TPA: hypothetical protein VFZ83_14485 [Acidimicrobiia bacterium]|nr:hypothetical protein [Acidimicrobiia bacterium]
MRTALPTTNPTDTPAPPVHLEACLGFVADADGGPCCAVCGWSADDHDTLSADALARAS